MGKLRQTALILGEGPTEFFYYMRHKSPCSKTLTNVLPIKRLPISLSRLKGCMVTLNEMVAVLRRL